MFALRRVIVYEPHVFLDLFMSQRVLLAGKCALNFYGEVYHVHSCYINLEQIDREARYPIGFRVPILPGYPYETYPGIFM